MKEIKPNVNEALLELFELNKVDERILTKAELKQYIPMIKIIISMDILNKMLEKSNEFLKK